MSNTQKKQLKRKRRKALQKRGPLTLVHSAASAQPLPSLRAMEGVMAGMFGGVDGDEGTAVDRAQQVMYDAWEATEPKRRIALARKALAISGDCADAYVLLAEEVRDRHEARQLLEQGVAAGERALGQGFFEENVGHFWGLLETRPYMRARCSLAQILWDAGEREVAVTHYQELLRLNPNDNQGVRDLLLPCLLELGRDKEAEGLVAAFEEDGTAMMSYSRALLAFRRDGDCSESRSLLRAAIKENRHVPTFLLGRKRLPKSIPDYHGFGDENEAICYLVDGANNWRATPGALDWLASSE